jgi:hypothetical protein
MNMTQREKILITFVPAVLVLFPYGFLVNRSKQTEIVGLKKSLDAATKAAPAPQKFSERRSHLLALQREVKDLEARTGKAQERWDALACQCADARKRNQRHQKLTTLLAAHHLSILDDGPGTTDKTCPSLEALRKQLEKSAPGQEPHLWRLRVSGGYLDMLGALDQLGTGEVLAIPVGLNMREAPWGSKSREWVLLVWI